MSCLYLLDRAKHTLSFNTSPDPRTVVWLNFDSLELPTKKFGSVDDIPWIEIMTLSKTSISRIKRVLNSNDFSCIVSTGRACILHQELIEQRIWRGKNIFVSVEGIEHIDFSLLESNNSIFLEGIEDRCFRKAVRKGIHVSKDQAFPIQSEKINEYIQDFL